MPSSACKISDLDIFTVATVGLASSSRIRSCVTSFAPFISKVAPGLVVPMPTLPVLSILILSPPLVLIPRALPVFHVNPVFSLPTPNETTLAVPTPAVSNNPRFTTCSCVAGLVVPIPTYPLLLSTKESVEPILTLSVAVVNATCVPVLVQPPALELTVDKQAPP